MIRQIPPSENSVDRSTYQEHDVTSDRRPDEAALIIEPIIGWRHWAVSPRQPWEDQAERPVLKGAWGKVWAQSQLDAHCLKTPVRPTSMLRGLLEQRQANLHSGPAPQAGCRCGIYAIKVGVIGPDASGSLAHIPRVTGFVELTGIVIEGSRGYRGQRATIVGFLELATPCSARVTAAAWCPEEPVEVVRVESTYRALCSDHARLTDRFPETDITNWRNQVTAQLQAIYQVPVVDLEKGGADGYR